MRAGARTDDDGIRLRDRLKPGGTIGSLADDAALRGFAAFDEIADDDEAGLEADPDLQAIGSFQAADRVDERQAGPHRPLDVVLMRLRVAEIGHDAVAHRPCDEAVKAGDRVGDAAPVSGEDRSEILRVQPRREVGGADEVAEHHRELSSLGGGARVRRSVGGAGPVGARLTAFACERFSAVRAKFRGGRGPMAASRAGDGQRRAAFAAKPAPFGHFRPASRAIHAAPHVFADARLAEQPRRT